MGTKIINIHGGDVTAADIYDDEDIYRDMRCGDDTAGMLQRGGMAALSSYCMAGIDDAGLVMRSAIDVTGAAAYDAYWRLESKWLQMIENHNHVDVSRPHRVA